MIQRIVNRLFIWRSRCATCGNRAYLYDGMCFQCHPLSVASRLRRKAVIEADNQ